MCVTRMERIKNKSIRGTVQLLEAFRNIARDGLGAGYVGKNA